MSRMSLLSLLVTLLLCLTQLCLCSAHALFHFARARAYSVSFRSCIILPQQHKGIADLIAPDNGPQASLATTWGIYKQVLHAAAGARMSVARILCATVQVFKGLKVIHDAGFAHLDLHIGNVLYKTVNGQTVAKVQSDAGVAA